MKPVPVTISMTGDIYCRDVDCVCVKSYVLCDCICAAILEVIRGSTPVKVKMTSCPAPLPVLQGPRRA